MATKDTIYIDVDDEITSIIDKVKSSPHTIVALVLPKRATMLQSSVNMKLLKRAADSSKKQPVLITSEASLMPLAGDAGLPVAKTLQSKPEIPDVSTLAAGAGMDELLKPDEVEAEDFEPAAVADKPVGELAGKAKPELTPRPIPRASEPDDTLDFDNADEPEAIPEASKEKKAKNKKLKIPDFNRFRLRLMLAAGLLILLIVGFILANVVLPKATVIIATNTSAVNSSLTLNLNTSATTLNTSNSTVPSQVQSKKTSGSQQVATTGSKNEGQTATGTVTMTAEVCSKGFIFPPSNVPAGVGISSGGLTFITQAETSFGGSTPAGKCEDFQATSSTPVTAQRPGAQYNLNNAPFTVSYQDQNNNSTTYSASGSTSGGSDNNVQVVAQADIDSAEKQISGQDTNSIKSGLESALKQSGFYPLSTTFKASTPAITTSANVGDQADTVTVTETITYSMFGVHQKDLDSLIQTNVNGQIDTSKQAMLDDGLSHAAFSVVSQSSTKAQINIQTTATVGPKLDIASLKQQIEGKKAGDVQSIISTNPGVTSVTVKFSPFWVNTVPKNTSKITIQFKKAS